MSHPSAFSQLPLRPRRAVMIDWTHLTLARLDLMGTGLRQALDPMVGRPDPCQLRLATIWPVQYLVVIGRLSYGSTVNSLGLLERTQATSMTCSRPSAIPSCVRFVVRVLKTRDTRASTMSNERPLLT